MAAMIQRAPGGQVLVRGRVRGWTAASLQAILLLVRASIAFAFPDGRASIRLLASRPVPALTRTRQSELVARAQDGCAPIPLLRNSAFALSDFLRESHIRDIHRKGFELFTVANRRSRYAESEALFRCRNSGARSVVSAA
jgi:hypothetical protein